MTEKKLVVKSTVTARKSSDMRQVARKAVAGLSEAELIERNSIETYREEEDDNGNSENDRTSKEKD